MRVILLNGDHQFLRRISVYRAIKLLKNQKAYALKLSKHVFRSAKEEIIVPSVLVLKYIVKLIYSTKIKWSRHNVKVRDNFTCVYCGSKSGNLKDDGTIVAVNIDHVIPRDRGGNDSFENTVCACFSCNSKKDNKTLEQSGMSFKNKYFKPYQPTVNEFLIKLYSSLNIENEIYT